MALNFLSGEANQALEVPQISLLEQFVAQHRAEGGCDGKGELERDAVLSQSAQHVQKRQISFGDGFEEPVFLEKILVLRVPDEGEMGVENEAKRSCRHG